MTGEMYKHDVTREAFPLHFAIADALNGHVEPFDTYQGPYICIGQDIRAGVAPYELALQGLGIVRLWVQSDGDGCATIYNEATERTSEPFPLWVKDVNAFAVDAAHEIL